MKMSTNPYQKTTLGMQEFLEIAYTKMKGKVLRLKELNKPKDELTLEEIKERFEITSNIIQSLLILQNNLDENAEIYKELTETFEMIVTLLTKTNVPDIMENTELANKYYDYVISILDGFLS
jgi:hypothetical protein